MSIDMGRILKGVFIFGSLIVGFNGEEKRSVGQNDSYVPLGEG